MHQPFLNHLQKVKTNMNNITTYLQWRGEISFQQVPYNEVDAYILSKIGVPDFSGILSSDGAGIPLEDVFARYFSRKDINPDYLGRLNLPILAQTLRQLPKTDRFGSLILSDYIQKNNADVNEQISALTISLPGGPTVITFRGTDDTIVGWKENFLMAVQSTVPAQADAVEYLTRTAQKHPGPLAIMGHSKGGNLAVYAAVMAPEDIQSRITKVYNFDGPGFRQEFWAQPGMARMKDRIQYYVSQHTMVGTMLTQPEEIIICRSNRSGPLAHEVLFWEVMGSSFVREKKLSSLSAEFGRLLNRQRENMTDAEISRFIEDFFGVLTSTGAATLTDLTNLSLKQLRRLLKEINGTESIKEFGKELAELLFHDARHSVDVLKHLRSGSKDKKL